MCAALRSSAAPAVAAPAQRLPLMETFYGLQGEGTHSGRPAYFIRLAGCSVGCHWCDVKESWAAAAHPQVEVSTICEQAVRSGATRAVITGGEPLQHNLDALTAGLQAGGLATHLETSGAQPLSGYWDWICFSPKKRAAPHDSVQLVASELKVVVYNRDDLRFAEVQARAVSCACALLLQPEWGRRQVVLPWLITYLKANPQWQLSLQTHKYLGLP